MTTEAPPSAAYNSSFNVAATASSGLDVAITTTGGCDGSGSGSATITMTSGTAACVVHYNQSGDDDYNAAPEVTSNTTASPADQTIEVTMDAPPTATFNSSFGVAATASSGLLVSITTGDGCTGSGSGSATITMTSGTTACVVHYNQPGSNNYSAAPEETSTTSAVLADQTIQVTTAAPTSAAFNSTFNVAATASSGFAVAIATTGGCNGSGSGSATITMTSGTTACVVHYNQSGNGNYNAAPEVTASVTALKTTQTIGFASLANRKLNQSPFTVNATASSGLLVTFTTTTPAICQSGGANGDTITLIAVGPLYCEGRSGRQRELQPSSVGESELHRGQWKSGSDHYVRFAREPHSGGIAIHGHSNHIVRSRRDLHDHDYRGLQSRWAQRRHDYPARRRNLRCASQPRR